MKNSNLVINCRIKSIKRKILDHQVPVYDIEVPTYSNFTLGNGCIVHNSKDILDTIAANVYHATQRCQQDFELQQQAKLLAETTKDLINDEDPDLESDILNWK